MTASLLPRRTAQWCAALGGVSLLLTVFLTFGLKQGGMGVHLSLVLCLAALGGLGLALLRREGYGREILLAALLPIGLALLLRVLCLDYASYDYRDFLAQWAAYFRTHGGISAIKDPVGNYNAPYLYFMALISYLPFPDLYAIKLFSILFDVLLAWGGLRLVKVLLPARKAAPLLAFCLLLLLPTVVLNGAYWGQCDSIYGAFVLHALACALDKRPGWSVALLAVAFSFKLQTIFLIPLWCVLWYGGRVKFRHLLLFPATYVLTILPAFLLGKPLGDILGVYLGQTQEYTHKLTFNAPSVFSLFPYYAEVDLAFWSKVGIIAAFGLVLAVLGFLFFHRDTLSGWNILAAGVVMAIGVPYLLPYMHERYFFLADCLTLVWFCVDRRRLPVFLLTALASLSSYCVYLRLKYTLVLSFFGQTWVMGVESLLMLAALALAVGALIASSLQKKPGI